MGLISLDMIRSTTLKSALSEKRDIRSDYESVSSKVRVEEREAAD